MHRPIRCGLVAGPSEISSARKESSESYECRGGGGYETELLRATYWSFAFNPVDMGMLNSARSLPSSKLLAMPVGNNCAK